MSGRRPKHVTEHSSSVRSFDPFRHQLERDQLGPARSTLSVKVYLPRSVALAARREVYPYPYPMPLQKKRRVIRIPLRLPRERMVLTKVRIRLPRRVPVAAGSYVSLSRGRLNIHSQNQLRRLYANGELNRRRYQERKSHRRMARYNQLNSPGATRSGGVAEAARRGLSIDRIADHALASRALFGW